jgi:predicted RNA binding protein with dsRBD fold (UPF0201 family)
MSGTVRDEEELDAKEVTHAPPGLVSVHLELTTPLHPTEDAGAVRSSVLNLFPKVDVHVGDGAVEGRGDGPASLARLRRRLREMRIRDTARSQFLSGVQGDVITFSLNKQSAYTRIPNFSTGGAPLGDIKVTIDAESPPAVVEWLCKLDDE